LTLRPPVPRKIDRDEAEKIAIAGLSHIAGDPERLSRFLALSGLDLGHLRAAAGEPGFLGGVLTFLAGDERSLLDFAAASGYAPEIVGAAFLTLNPPSSGEFD
jgi:hypothetical protein